MEDVVKYNDLDNDLQISHFGNPLAINSYARMTIIDIPHWHEILNIARYEDDDKFFKAIKFAGTPCCRHGSSSLQYPGRSIQDYFANFRK